MNGELKSRLFRRGSIIINTAYVKNRMSCIEKKNHALTRTVLRSQLSSLSLSLSYFIIMNYSGMQ